MAHPHECPSRWRDAGGQWSAGRMRADFERREALLVHRAAAAGLSRREFLATLAAGAAATAASTAKAARANAAAPLPEKSRVVVVTHPEVIIREYRVNLPVVRQMLDRAVGELTGRGTQAEAWADVAHEGDFLAIKYNTMHQPTLHSHTEINEVVTQRVSGEAGVDPARILAVDRRLPRPYREFSDPFTLPSRNLTTRLRRLYTEAATAIVNVSVLKTHFGEGMSAALKSHLGSVNNPSAYHGWAPGRMPRSLPELSALPPLRTKTRLVIVDAIRPLYAAGPFDDPEYRWDFRGLIVATDPVAADSVALDILERHREAARGKPWPMPAARATVAWGQRIGLGNAEAARIDRVEVAMG